MEDSQKSRKIIVILRVVFTMLTSACLLWIYSNSLENGIQSSAASDKVRETIQNVADNVFGEEKVVVNQHFVRKAAHFSEFALLGFLSFFMFHFYFCSKENCATLRFNCSSLLALFGGLSDEFIQIFVEDRGPSIFDSLLDFGGGECGIFFAWLILWIVSAIIKKAQTKRSEKVLKAE